MPDEPIGLVNAMAPFCTAAGESASDFLAQVVRLTDADRDWFRKRLEVEYDVIVAPPEAQ